MKLEHPKSWYEKNSEAEGVSEIGAGIPPSWQTRVGRMRQSAPAVVEIQPHGDRRVRPVHDRRATRSPLRSCAMPNV